GVWNSAVSINAGVLSAPNFQAPFFGHDPTIKFNTEKRPRSRLFRPVIWEKPPAANEARTVARNRAQPSHSPCPITHCRRAAAFFEELAPCDLPKKRVWNLPLVT